MGAKLKITTSAHLLWYGAHWSCNNCMTTQFSLGRWPHTATTLIFRVVVVMNCLVKPQGKLVWSFDLIWLHATIHVHHASVAGSLIVHASLLRRPNTIFLHTYLQLNYQIVKIQLHVLKPQKSIKLTSNNRGRKQLKLPSWHSNTITGILWCIMVLYLGAHACPSKVYTILCSDKCYSSVVCLYRLYHTIHLWYQKRWRDF